MNWQYLYVFFQSNILEVLFLLWFYGIYKYTKSSPSFKSIFLRVTLANSITHPVVLFLIMKGPFSYLMAILLAEAFAVIAEVYFHQRYLNVPFQKAIVGSFIANVISWQMGTMLTTVIFLSDRV